MEKASLQYYDLYGEKEAQTVDHHYQLLMKLIYVL